MQRLRSVAFALAVMLAPALALGSLATPLTEALVPTSEPVAFPRPGSYLLRLLRSCSPGSVSLGTAPASEALYLQAQPCSLKGSQPLQLSVQANPLLARVDVMPVRYRAADGTVVGEPMWIAAFGRKQQQCAAYLEADCGRGGASLGPPGGQQWVVERAGVMEQTEQGLRHNTTLFRILAKGSDELCGFKSYLGARNVCGPQPQLGLFDSQEATAATVFQLLRVPQPPSATHA